MTLTKVAEQYAEEGFAVIENALSSADLAKLKAAAANIVEQFDIDQHRSIFSTLHEDKDRDRYFFESAEAVHCFLEEGALNEAGDIDRPKQLAINKIGHAMHDLVPAFGEFCRLPIFSSILRAIGMQQPQLWQSMYIYKQPKIGGEVRWHQDASYLHAGEPGVVGMWIAMEDSDRTNGCLWVQPNGHRSPLREIYEVNQTTKSAELRRLDETPWPTESAAIPVEVSAGSILLFSDLMPHYSSQNTSDRSRQAFTLHFSELGSSWSDKNWIQRRSLQPFLVG